MLFMAPSSPSKSRSDYSGLQPGSRPSCVAATWSTYDSHQPGSMLVARHKKMSCSGSRGFVVCRCALEVIVHKRAHANASHGTHMDPTLIATRMTVQGEEPSTSAPCPRFESTPVQSRSAGSEAGPAKRHGDLEPCRPAEQSLPLGPDRLAESAALSQRFL
jgi:hypothetical protein